MLLGERLRTLESKQIVKEVVSKHCKFNINDDELYQRVFARDAERISKIITGGVVWCLHSFKFITTDINLPTKTNRLSLPQHAGLDAHCMDQEHEATVHFGE